MNNKVTRTCLLVVALLALVGLVSAQHPRAHFDLDDVHGRYISAENAADTSSVHAFSAPDASLVGPPIPFATAEVMVADGKGNVCGESDGFYSGISAPGVNLGPSLYHGQYTIGATDGRVVITTCSDASTVTGICQDSSPCPASAEGNSTRLQVGYIQGDDGNKMVTVSQFESGYPDSTGFLVHKRTWSKASEDRKDHDRR